jgi:hypothetical protein
MKIMSRTDGSKNLRADGLESDEVIEDYIRAQAHDTEEAVYAEAVTEASRMTGIVALSSLIVLSTDIFPSEASTKASLY